MAQDDKPVRFQVSGERVDRELLEPFNIDDDELFDAIRALPPSLFDDAFKRLTKKQ